MSELKKLPEIDPQELRDFMKEIVELRKKQTQELIDFVKKHELHRAGEEKVGYMILEYTDVMGEEAYNTLRDDAIERFGHYKTEEKPEAFLSQMTLTPDPTSKDN